MIGAIAPIGLAASAPTALVIDLDPEGPHYPGKLALADLVRESPRQADLEPGHAGTAVLRNGGIRAAQAREVVDALITHWPNVVLRLGRSQSTDLAPIVPVGVLMPGGLLNLPAAPAVYQRTGWPGEPKADGVILPRPRAATVAALLTGKIPRRSRWVRAWSQVWDYPWR
jgi:hypothetical protein